MLAHSTKLSTSSLTRGVVSIAKSSHNPVIGEWRGRPAHARRPVCVVIVYYYCCAFVRDRIMCIRVRGRQLAARGHCHSSTAISAFTRRPAAEGKLLLSVYLTRPVVGHRVTQATRQSAFTLFWRPQKHSAKCLFEAARFRVLDRHRATKTTTAP